MKYLEFVIFAVVLCRCGAENFSERAKKCCILIHLQRLIEDNEITVGEMKVSSCLYNSVLPHAMHCSLSAQ